MRQNITGQTISRLTPIAAAISLALPTLVNAADWNIRPRLDLRETYTDNITLASPGLEQGDFITEVSPGIAIRGTGSRLKLNAAYSMRNFLYAHRQDLSNVQHQLNASANAQLMDDLLFVDSRATMGVQQLSPFGPQIMDAGSPHDNRTSVKTFHISPYLRHRFGGDATIETRYSRDFVRTSQGGLADSQADRLLLIANSGTAFHLLQWNFTLDNSRINYTDSANVEKRQAFGTIRYLVMPNLALTGQIGYENNNYPAYGPKPEGYFWSIGTIWSPTNRTSITTTAGRRYFGDTYSLVAQHRARLSVWNLSYTEDVTTTRSQFILPVTMDTAAILDQLWSDSIPDSTVRADLAQEFIRDQGLPASTATPVNIVINSVFLQKMAQASVALRGTRNTLLLSAFHSLQEPQSAPLAGSLPPGSLTNSGNGIVRQIGANATWTWRLTSLSNATFGTGYKLAKNDTVARENRHEFLKIGLVHRLHRNARLGIELRHQQQQSNRSSNKYRESAISAFALMNF